MSVVIKGMKMPILCGECPCWHDGWCYAIREEPGSLGIPTWRDMLHPDWCPLVELPEKHGRLIEAPTRFEYGGLAYISCTDQEGVVDYFVDQIKALPTVLEAEGEE